MKTTERTALTQEQLQGAVEAYRTRCQITDELADDHVPELCTLERSWGREVVVLRNEYAELARVPLGRCVGIFV